MKVKLTKRVVETLAPTNRDQIFWDAELPGFGLKVTPAGRRAYFLYYRSRSGQQRRPFIGTHGTVTAEQARGIARSWLARVAAGEDPSRERQELRAAPTVSELCQRFLVEHSQVKNKPGTFYNYRLLVDRFLIPALGDRKVTEISPSDIHQLHHQLRQTPYQANRLVGLAGKVFAMAERWGYRPIGTNPVRGIDRYKERRRERYLSTEEFARLADVLIKAERDQTEMPTAIAAIRLLIATGCRLNEILCLKWQDVDLGRRILKLADTKTGPQTIHLNALAVEVLNQIPRQSSNPYVIWGLNEGQHLINLQKPWRRMRKQAGLDDVRLHDLRHSFASVAAGLGEGLPMIGKLLGHSQPATTSRYAHLAEDPVRVATERIGMAISAAMFRPQAALIDKH
jgi:integrase